MLEQEGWRNGDERWDTLFEERERKSGDGWSAGVNNDRVNGGGILSTEADRISRKPGAGDKGHVDVGREFQEPGTGSRGFSNPAVFMTSWVLVDSRQRWRACRTAVTECFPFGGGAEMRRHSCVA